MAKLGSLVILLFLNQIGKSHANGPCNSNYTTLDNVRRNVAYNKTTDLCDKDLIKKGTWYRFRSTAGDQILAEENPGIRSCGTYFPIWMEGTHPTVDDVITIVPVCVAIEGYVTVYDCNWVSGIEVVKCGSFFLYGLEPPNQCNASYCTTAATAAGKNATIPFPTTSPITGTTLLGNTTTHSPTTLPITIAIELALMPGGNTTTPFTTASSTIAGKHCADLYNKGYKTDGVYSIDPDGRGAFKVRCDMTTSEGGWTIFQSRIDGSVDFYRYWKDYKNGFGDPLGEYWLGLDKIHRLTSSGRNILRVDLQDTTGNTKYAEYNFFSVDAENAKYKLGLGTYSGTAGDSLRFQRGMSFSTRDVDNDNYKGNCAVQYKGAWWYKDCHVSNLNGLYLHGKHSTYADGINWYHWKGHYYSLKKTEMKLRPSGFPVNKWDHIDHEFLIYQAAHNVCFSAEAELVFGRSCDLYTDNQKWRWTQYNQLQNLVNQTCLGVRETPADWVHLKLSTCNRHDKYQVWVCVDDFIRLNGTTQNANYGNHQGGNYVVLYHGTELWSKWKIYGKNGSVCEKQLQVTTTPGGNMTTSSPTTLSTKTAKTSGGNMTTPSPTTLSATTDPNTRTDGILDELDRQVDDLYHQNISVQKKVANQVIDHLLNVTNLNVDAKQGENKLNPQNITTITKILQQIVGLNISDDNLNILGPASNILDIRNAESWENMTDNKVIRDLVVTLENYGFQYGENLKNSSNTSLIVIKYPNVQLKLRYIKNPRRLSQRKKLFKFPNSSFELSPDALPKKSGAVVVILWYKTLNSLIQNTSYGDDVNAGISREIITVNVRPPGKIKFSDPIRITWDYEELNGSKICVYWKPRLDENRWETDGCKRVKDKLRPNRLICECDHLTAFAVMDISGTKLGKGVIKALEIISTIGCAVSLVGVILTILVYALLWKRIHRNSKTTVPSQVLMHLCVAIGMTDIFAILAGPALKYEKFCIAVSVLLYFFVLALFGWMLCEGIIIYFQLVKVFSGLSLGGKHLKRFYVVGWGIPVIVVAVLVGANDRKDFITESACWCAGDSVLFWVFVATLGLILSINVVIFVLALRNSLSIWQVNSACEEDSKTKKATICAKLKKAKIGLKGSAVLLPILGLTWVFGLLVFNLDTIAFKYLFAIFNSLQGLMIFIFHVLINKKIQEEIIRKRNARKVKESANNNMANPTYLTPLTLEDAAKSRSSMPNDIDHRKDSDHQMTTFSPPKVRVD